jgi:Protein of unknown function (DUF3050)
MEIEGADDAAMQETRKDLVAHPLYRHLRSLDDVSTFAKYHVFAVWDFFSLLKRLQREVTCVDTPWLPQGMSDHARFILDIVISEESDEADDSSYISHFELYLEAMDEIGADRGPIDGYLVRLRAGADPIEALEAPDIPPFVRDFVAGTLDVALEGEPHEVAASFCHGRENLLPDVLTGVRAGLGPELNQLPIFKHYLDRHIALDHDEHGPLALRLLDALCAGDGEKAEAADRVGAAAIEARTSLWDGILAEIESAARG